MGDYKRCIDQREQIILHIKSLPSAETVFLGDFNINLFNRKYPASIALESFISHNTLFQIVKSPTRYSVTNPSFLDLIITGIKNIAPAGVLDCNLSDHLPI